MKLSFLCPYSKFDSENLLTPRLTTEPSLTFTGTPIHFLIGDQRSGREKHPTRTLEAQTDLSLTCCPLPAACGGKIREDRLQITVRLAQ